MPRFSFVLGTRTVTDPITEQLVGLIRLRCLFARDCVVLFGQMDTADGVVVAFAKEGKLLVR